MQNTYPIGYEREPEDDTVWGRDGSGTVGVGLAPSGELRNLEIASDWRRAVPSDRLAAEILSAYSAALSEQLERARQEERPSVAPSEASDDEVGFELFAKVMQEQAHYLATYDEKLRAECEFRSEDGNVTVTAQGGSPSAISFDDFWLSISDGTSVSAHVQPLLARAIASGQEIEREMRESFPAITEFRRLMAIEEQRVAGGPSSR